RTWAFGVREQRVVPSAVVLILISRSPLMCNILVNRGRFFRRGRGAVSFVALVGLLGLWTAGVRADEPDLGTQAYAHRLAVGVCGTCHGTQGNSVQPKFPRLAGQNPNYLVAQLKNFRGQTRGDPDAISYMWGMAGPLADDTIDALAKYYSTQHAQARKIASSDEI